MALMGAEILLYPTSVGCNSDAANSNDRTHWERVLLGQSASNMLPIVVANRVGTEVDGGGEMTFYGHSFITDCTGNVITQAEDEPSIIMAELDLERLEMQRAMSGLFRDRRPEPVLVTALPGWNPRQSLRAVLAK